MMDQMDQLTLKWGTMKAWHLKTEAARAAAKRYFEIGEHSMSAMAQHDTPEQREAMCDLIDAIDGEIWNDWDGVQMTKDEAKKYVREYRT